MALSKARFSGFSTTPNKHGIRSMVHFLPDELAVDSLSPRFCFALKLLTDLNIAAIQRY